MCKHKIQITILDTNIYVNIDTLAKKCAFVKCLFIPALEIVAVGIDLQIFLCNKRQRVLLQRMIALCDNFLIL